MSDFHDEIITIRNFWASGRITKISAIVQFEAVMHHFGLLPEDEEIDPQISDVALVTLMTQAFSLTPESLKNIRAEQANRKYQEQKNQVLAQQFGQLDRKAQYQCPVCQKWVDAIYYEIKLTDEDEFSTTLDEPRSVQFKPSRCEKCCQDYLDEYVFGTKRSYIPDTKMAPMSLTEQKFFRQYEEQMKDARIK